LWGHTLTNLLLFANKVDCWSFANCGWVNESSPWSGFSL